MRRIPISVATGISVRELNIAKLENWLGTIESRTAPRIVEISTKLDINGTWQVELDIELSNSKTRMRRNIDLLRRNPAFLP